MIKLTLKLIEENLRMQETSARHLGESQQEAYDKDSTNNAGENLEAMFNRGYATGLSAGANEIQRLLQTLEDEA